MTDRWTAVTTLTDTSRRALYDYVRHQDHPVRREEAAEATAMSRGLAAFHLDKLVGAGLLTARYEAPPGLPRGRGRAPKVYEPIGDGLSVTLPERRYELIADILAEAVSQAEVPDTIARRRGHDLGDQMRHLGGGVSEVLTGLGFEPGEPGEVDGTVVLHNCPFHALAARHTALICRVNLAFLGGLVDGLGLAGTRAVLAPAPGSCCVELRGSRRPCRD
jgi:predicted ArsR family transcriptional regulator